MSQKDLIKTLEELESVPCGIFHYGLEDKSYILNIFFLIFNNNYN